MKKTTKIIGIVIALLIGHITSIKAQVGEYRNTVSLGVSGGYVMNTIAFQPTVPQTMHGGMSYGLTARLTTEKYFATLCALQMEVNIVQSGWQQDILTIDNAPVINPETGVAETYKRTINYIQIPIFAHLSWGKEKKGVNCFINLGPQFGYMLSEKTFRNYTTPYTKVNYPEGFTNTIGRVSQVTAQETMPVENAFDFGIAVGLGLELHINRIGRFDLEGRFYYGLGNIYGDTKRDFFGASNHNTIYVKLGYLYDL